MDNQRGSSLSARQAVEGPDPYPWPRRPLTLSILIRRGVLFLETVANHIRGRRPVWMPSDEQPDNLAIADVIVPLRYDVLIRQQLIRLYSGNADAYRNDFERFLSVARQHPYRVWFTDVFVPRYHAYMKEDPAMLEAGFSCKVHRLVTLYERISERGFDTAFPIDLERLTTATRQVYPYQQYALTDGCHRIAVLLELGYTHLPRDHYRVRVSPVGRPLDITGELLVLSALSDESYFKFLSLRFAHPEPRADMKSLIAEVQSRQPAAVDDLQRILAQHRFL